jgi:HK97 family phage prohead protease
MQIKAMQTMSFKADATGTVSGYASRFGEIDQGGDQIAPGAYAKSLASMGDRRVKMLWQHDPSQPIGVWDEVREDDAGLFVKGRILSEVAKGKEAKALVDAGAIDGLSIGYRTIKADRGDRGQRVLQEVELWEVSLVTFPMQESARIDASKAAEMTKREFELALMQDAKLSRSVARALMGGGYEAVKAMQDAGDEQGLDELRAALRARIDLFT